jgi:hypothetical protein
MKEALGGCSVGTRLGRAHSTLEGRSISGPAMRDCDAREVVSLTPTPHRERVESNTMRIGG